MWQRFKTCFQDARGAGMLALIVVFGSVAFTIIISGVATYAIFENRASTRIHRRDMAFHIAEAGVNYYRWHLAHAPTDYQDGTGQPGPYVHPYTDKTSTTIGYFSLAIQPPLPGTTVVMVSSTGWTIWDPDDKRTVQVRLGYPALSDYTFLENGDMSFSASSNVSGQVHANGGIRFDGVNSSWIYSAKETYQYQGQTKNGVWGSGGDQAFWKYPVPAIDFNSVTADLSALKASAQSGGAYHTSSGNQGWHVVFKDTVYDLYRVTSKDCYYGQGYWWWWWWIGDIHCYDIRNETLVSSNNPLPANGSMFIEDHVWVEGTVDGRVSLGVGRFPVQSPYYNIYVTGNLTYKQRSSDDVTGLLAQGDIIIPYEVPTDMTIEAALLSQFEAIRRPYYQNGLRNSLTIFGSQISFKSGGMKWVNGSQQVVSGFINTSYLYDANLKYFPPPSFPVGNTYDLISWEELE